VQIDLGTLLEDALGNHPRQLARTGGKGPAFRVPGGGQNAPSMQATGDGGRSNSR